MGSPETLLEVFATPHVELSGNAARSQALAPDHQHSLTGLYESGNTQEGPFLARR